MEALFPHGWAHYLVGGVVMGVGMSLLFLSTGLIGGALVWLLGCGEPFVTGVPYWRLFVGGFIAGFGARLSNGCTAGHGICGMASLQPASILSVLLFLATAMVTARIVAAFA